MDIQKKFEEHKRQLAQKLELANNNDLNNLFAEKKALQHKIDEIEKKIVHVCSELGIDVGAVAPEKKKKGPRGPRMSGADIADRIISTLRQNSGGLSQKQLSDIAGVNYGSVINYLRENPGQFTSSGERKSKKIFLKA